MFHGVWWIGVDSNIDFITLYKYKYIIKSMIVITYPHAHMYNIIHAGPEQIQTGLNFHTGNLSHFTNFKLEL